MNGTESQAALMERHQDFVRALARDIHRGLPQHVDFEDVTQFGQVGLAEAAAAFDPTRGVAFKTFAYTRIRGAIFDGLSRMRGIPKQWSEDERKASREWSKHSGINAVCSEQSEEPGAAGGMEAAARRFRDAVGRIGMVCLVAQLPEGESVDSAVDDDPADRASENELIRRLTHAVEFLPPEEAAIIRMHYFEHRTFTDVAVALGKHKTWICRLHVRALDSLRLALEGEGTTAPVGEQFVSRVA